MVSPRVAKSSVCNGCSVNLLASAPLPLIWALIALLLAAAAQDAVQLKIANLLALAVAALAVLAMSLDGWHWHYWQNFAACAAVLVVGTMLFARGVFGGGDVKLFAAVALWIDGRTALTLLVLILLAGGFLALIILFLRTIVPDNWAAHVRVLGRRAGIPYGIAIATGTILTCIR